MALARYWTGFSSGTNNANLFLSLEGDDQSLTGLLRLNEYAIGIYAYRITGTFDGTQLSLEGRPVSEIPGQQFGTVKATAELTPNGSLFGQWETSIGGGGTFELFPRGDASAPSHVTVMPDQLHRVPKRLGAIKINKEQIIEIAEEIEQEFGPGSVIVTVDTGTEQSRYLDTFKTTEYHHPSASFLKLAAHKKEPGGTIRAISIEFGPAFNQILTESADEDWARGKAESLHHRLKKYRQIYSSNTKLFNTIGANDFLIFLALVMLPGIPGIWWRALFLLIVVMLSNGITAFHNKFLPHAIINLDEKDSWFNKHGQFISWSIQVIAVIVQVIVNWMLKNGSP